MIERIEWKEIKQQDEHEKGKVTEIRRTFQTRAG